MKFKCWEISFCMLLACAGILFCQILPLDGNAQDKAGSGGAGKLLIPHTSWPCGMAEGIPVPEQGVAIFEADLKLDQVYDIGKTP